MPTVKEANAKRKAYAWLVHTLIEQKEREARERLNHINSEQPELKRVWEQHQSLYNLHIKPLMPKVNQYWANENEKRKIEHFLQGQAEHQQAVIEASKRPMNQTPGARSWTLPPQVEKLPYADKGQIGKKPRKEKALTDDEAQILMRQIKALDPKIFDELLKQVGGK
jgi:hypothetical protein